MVATQPFFYSSVVQSHWELRFRSVGILYPDNRRRYFMMLSIEHFFGLNYDVSTVEDSTD